MYEKYSKNLKKILLSFKSVPSAICGRHITSAAIPDFHAKPSAVRQVVSNDGIINGSFIFKKVLAVLNL